MEKQLQSEKRQENVKNKTDLCDAKEAASLNVFNRCQDMFSYLSSLSLYQVDTDAGIA